MSSTRRILILGICSAVLAGCADSPEVLTDRDWPLTFSADDVGERFTLQGAVLSYEDGSDVIDVCYSVEEIDLEADDLLTKCGPVDLYVPLPAGFDFEAEGFERKEPESDILPHGWDRVADATIEITSSDGEIPLARIIELK